MKQPIKFVGMALCSLSITMAGNTLAASPDMAPGSSEEQTAENHLETNSCQLFFVKSNLGLQQASMNVGDPINTLHLFLTDLDGKIIKNAQVVTNIIGRDGHQHLTRALPFKGGYLLAIDHLAAGTYLVETEIIARGQFLTNIFRFSKA